MAQLDRFLAAMSEYKAEALILEQNRAPAFRFDSGTKPVSRQVLDTERILGLISELTGTQVGDDCEFEYDTAGRRYQGRVGNEAGGIVAVIRQVVEDHGEPPTGGVPQPPAGAYRAESGMVNTVQAPPPEPAPAAAAAPATPPPVTGTNGKGVSHLPTVGEVQLEFQVPDDLPQDYRRRIDDLLREMVRRGASDLHLCCKHGPIFRVDGHVAEDTVRRRV